ncbi:HAMP domain-containing histidine kinase [Pedobacter sp. PAMC26386]|nr:HAMP domain-containing histidine kinase [Pedobacter sp. PAMC26386]
MTNRIKYILGLMTICILGVIVTQGVWLYKDYRYYSGQPLFSTDFDVFLPTQTMAIQKGAKSILAFSTTVNRSGVAGVASSSPLGATTPRVSAILAYPVALATAVLPFKIKGKDSLIRISPRISNSLSTPADFELDGPGGNYKVTEKGKAQVFQAVPYRAPVLYVLQKMKWQFGASILLILFTTSCFIYMLITIFMQRKLSAVKNDMINNMTHELKTPLSTVSVAIEAMRNYKILEDKEKTNLYLNVSKNELDHLSRLIEMILELSVFEHHKMILFKEPVNINRLIKGIVKKYSLVEETVDIQLFLDEIPELLTDPVHLGNAIRNLIDNAIKYSLCKPQLIITSSITKKGWALTVSDNGIGIPEIYQKSVFDQFFRVPDKRLLTVKGFGLGLSYVKQVVEQHNGSISLLSNGDTGSFFTIVIPVKSLKV